MLKSRFHVIKHIKIYSKIGLTRKTRRYASKTLFDEKNAARRLKAVFPPTQTAQSPGGRVPANQKRTEPRRFPREDFYGSTRKTVRAERVQTCFREAGPGLKPFSCAGVCRFRFGRRAQVLYIFARRGNMNARFLPPIFTIFGE